MATIIPLPVVMEFTLDKNKNLLSTRHYNLTKGQELFSANLNISEDRKCAKSSPKFWLKIRKQKKWSSCITGLFLTSFDDWYFGDTDNKKNQVIFHFEHDKLRLFFFTNFYTRRIDELINTIKRKY